jgi:hypothetical protein
VGVTYVDVASDDGDDEADTAMHGVILNDKFVVGKVIANTTSVEVVLVGAFNVIIPHATPPRMVAVGALEVGFVIAHVLTADPLREANTLTFDLIMPVTPFATMFGVVSEAPPKTDTDPIAVEEPVLKFADMLTNAG